MLRVPLFPYLLILILASGCSEGREPTVWVFDRPTRPTLDLVDYEPVTLPELLRRPEPFLSRGVALTCRYHGPAQVYTPGYTDFTESTALNFSVWAPEAPLWEPEAFADDFPFCYVDRRRKAIVEDLSDLKPFDLVEIQAYVASVFGGHPYLRVDKISRRGGPKVTMEGLKTIHAAVSASREGRWSEGVVAARQALGNSLPPGAEPQLHKALGHCLLESGDSREALSELAAASRDLPGDADLLKWEGRSARSLALAGKGRHAESVAFLQSAQAQAPADPEIPMLLAEAHLAAGQPAEAISAADRAVILDPKNPETHIELAALKSGQGQLDGAIQSYRNSLALEPGRWRVWSDLARVQIRKGDMDGASASFEKAFTTGGTAVPADDHYLAGRCYQSLGRTEPSRKAFQAALAMPGPWGGTADAQSALGELAFKEKDFPAAVEAYQAALATRPKDADFLACLGVARLKAGAPAGAREALEAALDAGVSRPAIVGEDLARACLAQSECLAQRSAVQAAAKDEKGARATRSASDEALRAASKAIARACDREETAHRRFLQGDIARRRGEPKQAEKAFARASELDSKDVQAYLNRAMALVEMEEYGKAVEVLAEGERLDANNPALMVTRAYAMLKDGKDTAGALPLAEKAFVQVPQNPEAQHAYGWALLANGKAAEAVPVLKDAAKAGDVPEVEFHLAQAYVQAGSPEDARPVLEALSKGDSAFARPARKLLKSLPKPPSK